MTDLPTDIPTNLQIDASNILPTIPTDIPIDIPTDIPTDLQINISNTDINSKPISIIERYHQKKFIPLKKTGNMIDCAYHDRYRCSFKISRDRFK